MGTGMIKGYAVIDNRLRRLERDKYGQEMFDNTSYSFLVAPSCPPDKRVHIRGGVASPVTRWGYIMYESYTPSWTCDFEDLDETDMELNFINPNYYLPIILCYFGDWIAYRTAGSPEPVFDNVIGTEVATAEEAEAQIDALLNGSEQWFNYRFPLRGIVFRNDGVTGIDVSILPIDAVNRGRSYLYRDARARNCLTE